MAARRVSLPSADDLFRPTADNDDTADTGTAAAPRSRGKNRGNAPAAERETPQGSEATDRKPSGRIRHDEKMTVYVTSDELLELEHARLSLRRHHSLAVDRGRLVREAIAIVLADLDANGEGSALVRRLTEE